jgi:alginate O-acetyltransferase complex protein AlgJ
MMSEREHNDAAIDYGLHSKPVISYGFILFLISALAMGVWMLVTQQAKLQIDKTSMKDFLEGRTAFAFEKKFEDVFPLKDAAVNTFGALSYGVMHSGRDGVVLGKDGWYFTKEEFEDWKGADQAQASKVAFVKNVKDYLAAHHVGLVVALIPSKTRVYEEYLRDGVSLPESRRYTYEQFRKALLDTGVVVPDLEIVMREGKSSDAMFMHTDTHWTAAGAKRVANALKDVVKQSCSSLSLAEQTFKTVEGKEKQYDGDLLRYVKTGFLRPYVGPSAETVKEFQTDAASGAGDLFGDATVEVTLVGTSYSAQKDWHFDGFLREALRADVLNLADEGKGPVEPMVNFLKTVDLKSAAPKLVIWEIPERFITKTYDIVLPELKTAADVVAPCQTQPKQGEAQ